MVTEKIKPLAFPDLRQKPEIEPTQRQYVTAALRLATTGVHRPLTLNEAKALQELLQKAIGENYGKQT